MAGWERNSKGGWMSLVVLAVVVPAVACSPSRSPTEIGVTKARETPGPAPMMEGKNGHRVDELFTVRNSINGYQPIGILDGIGAYELDSSTVRLLVNHEVDAGSGYAYGLANGTQLTGARISYFDVDKTTREIVDAGQAFGRAYDRSGSIVTDAAQINETGHPTDGFSFFCSAQYIAPGGYGFLDAILFTNEEVGTADHPHGGTVWALDVEDEALWGLPALGRGVWENVTPLDTGDTNTIALLLADDTNPAPLYLWIGSLHPEAAPDMFTYRNGLEDGTLYVWVADDSGAGAATNFTGTGASRAGVFAPIAPRDVAYAGEPGYDNAGYKDADTLRNEAIDDLGAFRFARPEDVATNPDDGTVVALAATGAKTGPADWGAVYLVNVDFSSSNGPTAVISILHDSNDWDDDGIRNPDNVDWAANGYIYVQEDGFHPEFGSVGGRDASIMQLDPQSGAFVVVAEMKRSGRFAHLLGQWESSGVLDVTGLFGLAEDDLLLVATVQAHGEIALSVLADQIARSIADDQLVASGQLIWVTRD